MSASSLRPDRLGIVAASALGLVTAAYFDLEARGILPSLLAGRSQALTTIFSERAQTHASLLAEPWIRALAFALTLSLSLATIRTNSAPPRSVRIGYWFATFAFPAIALVVTLVIQPLALGDLCVPCLLESLFALAILECRKHPEQPSTEHLAGARLPAREA